MKGFYLLLDRWISTIPPRTLQLLRWGAISLWLFLAVIIGIYAWQQGEREAVGRSTENYPQNIRQQVLKKQNLEKMPPIVLPDIHTLIEEQGSRSDLYDDRSDPTPDERRPLDSTEDSVNLYGQKKSFNAIDREDRANSSADRPQGSATELLPDRQQLLQPKAQREDRAAKTELTEDDPAIIPLPQN